MGGEVRREVRVLRTLEWRTNSSVFITRGSDSGRAPTKCWLGAYDAADTLTSVKALGLLCCTPGLDTFHSGSGEKAMVVNTHTLRPGPGGCRRWQDWREGVGLLKRVLLGCSRRAAGTRAKLVFLLIVTLGYMVQEISSSAKTFCWNWSFWAVL